MPCGHLYCNFFQVFPMDLFLVQQSVHRWIKCYLLIHFLWQTMLSTVILYCLLEFYVCMNSLLLSNFRWANIWLCVLDIRNCANFILMAAQCRFGTFYLSSSFRGTGLFVFLSIAYSTERNKSESIKCSSRITIFFSTTEVSAFFINFQKLFFFNAK